MKEMLYGSHIVTTIRKSSPYKEHLNQIISNLYETGIVYYWEGQTIRRYMSERLQTAITKSVLLDKQSEPMQLTVDHLQGAFVILGIGLAVATVFCIAEMGYCVIKQLYSNFKNKFG
jgi:hypothetical protein